MKVNNRRDERCDRVPSQRSPGEPGLFWVARTMNILSGPALRFDPGHPTQNARVGVIVAGLWLVLMIAGGAAGAESRPEAGTPRKEAISSNGDQGLSPVRGLTIEPARVVLDGPLAQQQVIATDRGGAGRVRDVTALAAFEVTPTGIVEIRPGGVLLPRTERRRGPDSPLRGWRGETSGLRSEHGQTP